MNIRQAVILAGGKGTRLASRLNGLPKSLIDICGKPLLQHQIELLKSFDLTDLIMLTGHGADHIKNFCLSHNSWGMNIRFVSDATPLGTAGSVMRAFPYLHENFLVVYGDTMLQVDLDRFASEHFDKNAGATIFLHPNDHPFDSDIVEIDDSGHIKAFYPCPHTIKKDKYLPNLVNAALYCVKRSAIEPWAGKTFFMDFAKDLFPKMLRAGTPLIGYSSSEYIKDCGTPDRLDRVCGDFISGKISRSSFKQKQPVIFLDRDGTLNKEVGYISNPSQLELLPDVGEAIKKINTSVYRAVVLTNQPVVARGACSLDDLRQIHNKLETLLSLDGAYLDKIYFCPHHTDKGFAGEILSLKINCTCRKPNIGMIEAAMNDMNVNLSLSWLIGDTSTDVLTAKNAGIRSIIVGAGNAEIDCKYNGLPNYSMPNLNSAVNFILYDHPKLINNLKSVLSNVDGIRFILVGGPTALDKSNFSNCIKDTLDCMGINSIVVSVDRWLRRDASFYADEILGRYDIDAIAKLISDLHSNEDLIHVRLPFYNKLLGKSCLSADVDTITGDSIIILEGAIALHFSYLIPKNLSRNIYLEADSGTKKIFFSKHRARKLTEGGIEKKYPSKEKGETDFVLSTKRYADICLRHKQWQPR